TEKVSFEQLGEKALQLLEDEKTFRISTNRVQKAYKSSQEVNEEIGGFILERKKDIRVDLKKPEAEIFIEIFQDGAYVYKTVYPGLGGLPVGVSGDVFLDATNEKYATAAGYFMMKRGCTLVTPQKLQLLDKFAYGFTVHLRAQLKEDIVVSDKLFEDLDLHDKTALAPLTGFSAEEIEILYRKITQL
ncbi:hypothetical protein HZB00_03095, partial [Candidatus Woesearchaeota archaeon]|nr:hypothetical protein [Candidatus Woesearchaeota archaeon]